jgi:hypothetical protein
MLRLYAFISLETTHSAHGFIEMQHAASPGRRREEVYPVEGSPLTPLGISCVRVYGTHLNLNQAKEPIR